MEKTAGAVIWKTLNVITYLMLVMTLEGFFFYLQFSDKYIFYVFFMMLKKMNKNE